VKLNGRKGISLRCQISRMGDVSIDAFRIIEYQCGENKLASY
jgi:hypothetical protein